MQTLSDKEEHDRDWGSQKNDKILHIRKVLRAKCKRAANSAAPHSYQRGKVSIEKGETIARSLLAPNTRINKKI